MARFIPAKRIALDGVAWWCVWDCERSNWSTFICHGKYRTKKECLENIRYHNKKWCYWGI